MSETERVLNFSIEDTDQLVEIIKGLTKLNVDVEADSTPSSIKITLQGPEHKVRNSVQKIQKLVEESKN